MTEIIGWDIGGAHLKLARTRDSTVLEVRQIPCPLWLGLNRLAEAMDRGLAGWPAPDAHALTMTGELVDLFPDRARGVHILLAALAERVISGTVLVYAVDGAFLTVQEAIAEPGRVASANWHAAARLVALRIGDGLLVDIGSTTTDLVPLRSGEVACRGSGDAERLARDELVYCGVVRTPIMAIARHAFLDGERIGIMAEHFATMADVYRLTGELPLHADQQPAADGRGKSLVESRARLARMVGRDASGASDEAWDRLAQLLASRQSYVLEQAARRVLSGLTLAADAPLVGAGVGRFVAKELARRLRRPYRSFAEFVAAPDDAAAMAADCAPAAAVALLCST